MDRTQKLQLRQSELKVKLGEMLDTPEEQRGENFSVEMATLTGQVKGVETELQAAILASPEPEETRVETLEMESAEDKEFRELRAAADFGRYVAAAISGGGIRSGAELEFNQHLGIADNEFPMEMLIGLETRAKRDGDANASQRSWVDRVFAQSAAQRVGVTFSSVPAGVAAFPVTSAGGSGVQRGREEAVAESTYTISVTELKPSRAAINGVYSIEDNARLPGMADAIMRDMRMAIVESADKAIFKGDDGANENGADITGFQTGLDAAQEVTITQANKVLGTGVLAAFAGMVDGQYASGMGDLRAVLAVGAHTLWASTIPGEAAGGDSTIAERLKAAGVDFMVRGGIETATGNGKFGGYVGLGRGIAGAAVAPVWNRGEMIRDPYTSAKKGEVVLTLNYLWNFGIPRKGNFRRVKFVT